MNHLILTIHILFTSLFADCNPNYAKLVSENIAITNPIISSKSSENGLNNQSINSNKFNPFALVIIFVQLIAFVLLLTITKKARDRIRKLQDGLIKQKEFSQKQYIKGQEDERERFVKDFHDSICNQLASILLKISKIKPNSTLSQTTIEEIVSMCSEIQKEFRNVINNLQTYTLQHSGLITALDEQLENIRRRFGVDYLLNNSGFNENLTMEMQSALFRISQEIITNILKHSSANYIRMYLCGGKTNQFILITYNDNGFDKENLENSAGYGWKNIQARLEAIDGEISIETSTTHNLTSISIKIPYE